MNQEIDHEIKWNIDDFPTVVHATEIIENGETQFGIDSIMVEAMDLLEGVFPESHAKSRTQLIVNYVYQPIDIKQYFTDSFISCLEDEVWKSIKDRRAEAKADDKYERGRE